MPKKYNYTKKTGRPSKYNAKYCKEMIAFFDKKPSYASKVITTGRNDYEKIEEKLLPINLPTFERFASTLDVSVVTLDRWAKKHKKFCLAYEKCRELQKDILVANGLSGLYASNFAIFVAKNFTNMKDKTETDITSGGKPIPILGGATAKHVHTNNRNKEDTEVAQED